MQIQSSSSSYQPYSTPPSSPLIRSPNIFEEQPTVEVKESRQSFTPELSVENQSPRKSPENQNPQKSLENQSPQRSLENQSPQRSFSLIPLSAPASPLGSVEIADEAPREAEISPSVLAEYLKAVAQAQTQRFSVSSLGLVVLATSVATAAYFALSNNQLHQEILHLQTQERGLNQTISRQSEVILNLKKALSYQKLGTSTLIKAAHLDRFLENGQGKPSSLMTSITDLFYKSYCPVMNCTGNTLPNKQCISIPFFGVSRQDMTQQQTISLNKLDQQYLGEQKRCLEQVNEDNNFSLSLSIQPDKLNPNNGSSALYNQGVVRCQTQRLNPLAEETILCSGWFITDRKYLTPFNGENALDSTKQNVITYLNAQQDESTLWKLKNFIQQGFGI